MLDRELDSVNDSARCGGGSTVFLAQESTAKVATNLMLCRSAFCSFSIETQEGTACGRKWDVEVMVCENEPLGMSKLVFFYGSSYIQKNVTHLKWILFLNWGFSFKIQPSKL